jgi:hypothetical protein
MFEHSERGKSAVAALLDTDPEVKKACGAFWGALGEPCRLSLTLVSFRIFAHLMALCDSAATYLEPLAVLCPPSLLIRACWL